VTQNYRRVTSQNTWLFEEAVRNGGPLSNNTEYERNLKKDRIRARKAGPGVKNRQRAVEKYEGRKNQCPVCNLAMPAGGGGCCD